MEQPPDYSLEPQKRIALVVHDKKKKDLLEWGNWNRARLEAHIIIATGTTGKLLEEALGIEVIKLQSGPLGGDQQLGAKITNGEIDLLIFFWGSTRDATPRYRCESPAADRGRLEHSGGLQSRVGRLHHLIALDVWRISASHTGL
jgi:hypothetical protein